jgi:bifunctional non-homologous end joining protein LigD
MAAKRVRTARPKLEDLVATYPGVQLATLSEELPRSGAWSYELKYDGYRILAMKVGKAVRLISRNGHDWTDQFASVAESVAELDFRSCVVDGEVCALDAAGKPSFQLLQNRARGVRVVYFVFDVLFDGEDVRGLPIEQRRERLASVVSSRGKESAIALSSPSDKDGASVFQAACAAGMEGVVAKQVGSPYVAGRSKAWLKIKCTHRQEFAIVGWLPLEGSRTAVGALLLAVMGEGGAFHYAGKVGTGFDNKTRASLFTMLRDDETKTPTAADVPKSERQAHFVEPKHVAEVAFTEWTEAGHVRHPSFQGLRADKRPEECVREGSQ